jgi:O-antigen ligase
MAALFLAGAFFLQRRAQVQRLLVVLVLAGISQAILGYVQFAFALGPQAFAAQRLFLRAYGTFDQPNPYAGYLNMMFPLALGLAIAPRHGRPTRIWWSATVVILGAVLASESRGALLATVAALLVVVPLRYREVRVPLLAGAVAAATAGWLAALGLVPLGPAARLLSAVGLGSVDFSHVTDANFSAVERAAHWLAGVRMFAAHPILGVGIGNYAAVYGAYHPRGWYAALEHAHNYYINIAAEAGVVGLIAYVLLAGSALWYSYAAIRRVQDPVYRAAVLGVMGALVATSFHNLFDVLYVHGMAALLGILMALVACSLRATPEGALGEQQSSAIESIRFTDVRGRVNKSMYSRDLR